MHRGLVAMLALAAIVTAGVLVTRNGAPVTGDGWTGVTEPEELIEARRLLMIQTEQLMKPIDTFTVDGAGDLPALRSAAATIEAMILASPHLFPPTTNLYDPAVRESPTFALPVLWDDFAMFRASAEHSAEAAAAIAESEDAASLRTAGRSLRASCDGCHARFTRPYTPPRVTQEDLDFDFSPLFPEN